MTKIHRRGFVLLLFALLVVLVNAEVEDGLKKRPDVTQKSKSEEESDDEVGKLYICTVQAKSLNTPFSHLFLKCLNFYNIELIIFFP